MTWNVLEATLTRRAVLYGKRERRRQPGRHSLKLAIYRIDRHRRQSRNRRWASRISGVGRVRTWHVKLDQLLQSNSILIKFLVALVCGTYLSTR